MKSLILRNVKSVVFSGADSLGEHKGTNEFENCTITLEGGVKYYVIGCPHCGNFTVTEVRA